ncbi:unnamed protein product [Gadus morhua 'NCC']
MFGDGSPLSERRGELRDRMRTGKPLGSLRVLRSSECQTEVPRVRVRSGSLRRPPPPTRDRNVSQLSEGKDVICETKMYVNINIEAICVFAAC